MDESHGLTIRRQSAPDRFGLTLDQHAAAVGLVYACQQFDEGRFAGAVLAQQCDDLAAVDVEAHGIDRLGAAEALADGVEAKQGLRHAALSVTMTDTSGSR